MSRAYRFLELNGLTEMANDYRQPVFLVRLKGGEWERQPAASIEDAARKFIRYANVKSGQVIEALGDDQDPAKDEPITYKTTGKPGIFVKCEP